MPGVPPTEMVRVVSVKQVEGHPAPFPVELARDHIYSWPDEGEIILDPMCGSGTTCKAAIQLGRRFIGTDTSREYLKIAKTRIANVHYQPRLPVNGVSEGAGK